MTRKLTLFSVCALQIALVCFTGIQSARSDIFEPFKNGVGILCENKNSKDDKRTFVLFVCRRSPKRVPSQV